MSLHFPNTKYPTPNTLLPEYDTVETIMKTIGTRRSRRGAALEYIRHSAAVMHSVEDRGVAMM